MTPEEAFPHKNEYPGYADVADTAWYADAARVCYEVGLITGTRAAQLSIGTPSPPAARSSPS